MLCWLVIMAGRALGLPRAIPLAAYPRYAGLPPPGAPLAAGEPLGHNRRDAILRQHHHEQRIILTGLTAGSTRPVVIGPSDWSAAHYADNELVQPDGRHCFYAVKVRPTQRQARPSKPGPRTTAEARIRDALRRLYTQAKEAGKRPPNVREAVALTAKPLGASTRQCLTIASEDEFKRERQRVGRPRAKMKFSRNGFLPSES